jgi:hypothetical protein
MARTFLQLVQQACNEIGIPAPQSIIGNQNSSEQQLLALANREAKEFSAVANKNGGWQNLHKEYTFNTEFLNTTGNITSGSAVITGLASTTGLSAEDWGISSNGFQSGTRILSVDSPTQVTVSNPAVSSGTGVNLSFGRIAYPLPSDFEYFVDKTFWDNKYKWALIGPITAQEKQILRYGVLASGPRNKFYIRMNKMWLDPVPSESTLIAYDYYSNAPVLQTGGSYTQTWQNDDDVYVLDEDCFIQGLKWRFLRAKGLDYAEEFNSYEKDVSRTISRDGGSRDLMLNSDGYSVNFLNTWNIPDTNFGRVQ